MVEDVGPHESLWGAAVVVVEDRSGLTGLDAGDEDGPVGVVWQLCAFAGVGVGVAEAFA